VGVKSEGEVSLPCAVGLPWLGQSLVSSLGALFPGSLKAAGFAAAQPQGPQNWKLGFPKEVYVASPVGKRYP
jgi:hypothetical protein